MNGYTCRFCGTPLKDVFIDMGVSPLANNYLRQEELFQMEPFYPLRVYVCDNCYLVQMPAFEPPEKIFGDYAYFSSYSESWLRHAADYSEEVINRFGIIPSNTVIEIASNDGYLLRNFKEKGIPVLGIEPARNVAEAAVACGIPTLVEFFGVKLAEELRREGITANLLVGNNVLAHVPDINDFVRGLKTILHPQGVMTMEFPHLMKLMKLNQFDTIYHEHFSYFSLIAVQKIFAAHGLAIFDVEELPTHGGSLRIYARHASGGRANNGSVSALRERELKAGFTDLNVYRDFAERAALARRNILDFMLRAKKENKKIAGYGAPAKGNTLLNYCGLGPDFIEYTVDKSPHKQGRYLPGSHIPVYSPEKIKETKPDYLVILPWNLKEEIIGQMSHIREWGASFVVLIPDVEVLP
jgi:hypothetical protein